MTTKKRETDRGWTQKKPKRTFGRKSKLRHILIRWNILRNETDNQRTCIASQKVLFCAVKHVLSHFNTYPFAPVRCTNPFPLARMGACERFRFVFSPCFLCELSFGPLYSCSVHAVPTLQPGHAYGHNAETRMYSKKH